MQCDGQRASSLARRLLAGTALATAVPLVPGEVSAQQGSTVRGAGKLDIAITGFARFPWAGGDVAEKLGGRDSSSDFRTDTEVHIVARGEDAATGLRYGATIAFEADTDRTDDTAETRTSWWARSTSSASATSTAPPTPRGSLASRSRSARAASTARQSTPASWWVPPTAPQPPRSSPEILGSTASSSASYTPDADSNGDDLAPTDVDGFEDRTEAGLICTGELGGEGIRSGVVGGRAETNFENGDDGVVGVVRLGVDF